MQIGLLTTSFPRWEEDIAGSFVLGFARALAQLGHQVEVLAPEPSEPVTAPHWPGVDVRLVPYLRPRSLQRTFYGAGVPDNLLREPRAWLGLAPFAVSLAHATRRGRPRWDALVSHWALPCGLTAALLRQARPHLCVFHSADLHLLSKLPLRRAIAQQLADGSSQLLFVSARHRTQFLQLLSPDTRAAASARAHVQAMGIEIAPPSTAPGSRDRTRAELGLERFTLLTIGRLVPVKGLAQALRALAHRADLEWLIAGEGPERARLQALCPQLGLRVRLLGNVTGAAKQALLRAADAFVLPSRVLASGRSEGVPTAALESMAHGVPLIASAVGGIGEVVRDLDTGLLYDPTRPGALERCVDRLRLDPALATRLRARAELAARAHAWDQIGPRLEALLR